MSQVSCGILVFAVFLAGFPIVKGLGKVEYMAWSLADSELGAAG